MKKKVFGRKLSRSSPSRKALFAGLSRSMILNGKIETTRAKAKAVQGSLEKLVTIAKKGDLAGKRKALAVLDNARDAMDALYQNVAPSFSGKKSGFIRLISLPPRKGDNASVVKMEWTEKVAISEKGLRSNSKTEKKIEAKKTVKSSKKTTKR